MVEVASLMFLAGLLTVVLVTVGWAVQHWRQAGQLDRWAKQKGWRYRRTVFRADLDVEGLFPMTTWSSTDLMHVIEGRHGGYPFTLYEFRFSEAADLVFGSRSNTPKTARACLIHPGTKSPGVLLRPETMYMRGRDKLTGEDVDFESFEFSQRFHVMASDRRFAYGLFNAENQHWFLQRPDRTWHWRGERLLVMEEGSLEPKAGQALLEDAHAFRAMIPRHLRARREGGSG